MVGVTRELENSNTKANGDFKIGNQLSEWRKKVPSRRLEFESIVKAVGEKLKESISEKELEEIKKSGHDVIKYMAVKRLASLMFPTGNLTTQKNKLSLDAMEMMFSRLYPKLQSVEFSAEINHRHHLEVPKSEMDNILDKVLESERKRFIPPDI